MFLNLTFWNQIHVMRVILNRFLSQNIKVSDWQRKQKANDILQWKITVNWRNLGNVLSSFAFAKFSKKFRLIFHEKRRVWNPLQLECILAFEMSFFSIKFFCDYFMIICFSMKQRCSVDLVKEVEISWEQSGSKDPSQLWSTAFSKKSIQQSLFTFFVSAYPFENLHII